jgi:hypothetical protein
MFGLDLFTLVAIAVFIGLALWLASNESLLFLIGLTIVGLFLLGNSIPLLTIIKANPYSVAGFVFVYFLIGTVWAFFKWYLFVRARVAARNAKIEEIATELKDKVPAENVRSILKDFIKKGNTLDEPRFHPSQGDDYSKVLGRFVKHYDQGGARLFLPPAFEQPLISRHKESFTTWLTFWPFSAMVFMFADMIRELATSIYNYFGKQLQAISDRMWQD